MEKTELLNYLSGIRTNEATYHNRKETLSWAAIGFYTFIVAGLSGISGIGELSFLARIILSSLVVGMAVVLILFTNFQIEAQGFAADIVALCFMIEAKILKEENFNQNNYLPSLGYYTKGRVAFDFHCIYPQFLYDAMDELICRRAILRERLEQKRITLHLSKVRIPLFIFICSMSGVMIWFPKVKILSDLLGFKEW